MKQRLLMGGLSKALGASERNIATWLTKGLPHGSKKNPRGGKRVLTFDLEKVHAWLAQHGIVTKGMSAAAYARAEDLSTGHAGGRDMAIDEALSVEPGIVGSVERLKQQEMATARLMLELKKSKAAVSNIVALQKQYAAEVVALRQGELAALEYRRAIGVLCVFDDMVKAWERAGLAVKNAVMAIGNSSVPLIRQYLRNANDAHHIKEIIDRFAHDALIQVTGKCPTGSDR